MNLRMFSVWLGAACFLLARASGAPAPVAENDAETGDAAVEEADGEPGYRFLLRETVVTVDDAGLRTTRLHNRILVEKARAIEAVADVDVPDPRAFSAAASQVGFRARGRAHPPPVAYHPARHRLRAE